MSEEKKTNRGWQNLQGKKYSFANIPKERLTEISRKGQEKTTQIRKERRTAKQALTDILALEATPDIINSAELPDEVREALKAHIPNITMYDLLQLVAVGLGVGGNMRALEYVRDTAGDQPVKQIELNENVTTDADRELIARISERLNNPDITIVADVTAKEGADNGKNDGENRS